MPQANQYSFDHKELLALLIQKAGLHEGLWMLSVSFNIGTGNFGVGPDEALPGTIVTVQSVGLSRADNIDAMPPNLILDASLVNPKK